MAFTEWSVAERPVELASLNSWKTTFFYFKSQRRCYRKQMSPFSFFSFRIPLPITRPTRSLRNLSAATQSNPPLKLSSLTATDGPETVGNNVHVVSFVGGL
jgi:hypothetical protein